MITQSITKAQGSTAYWNVSAPNYISQSGSVVLNSDITLNVDLEQGETTITVSFDSNGGSSVQPITVTTGRAYGTLPVSVKAGYNFQGWFTSGGTQITSSTIVTETTNHTLYAHWEQITETITVTFDPQGGSIPYVSKTVTPGQIYGELPTPTKTGNSFQGWFTSGNVQITSATIVIETTNHTLYAHWISYIDIWASWTGGTTSSNEYYTTIIGGTNYRSLTSPISKSSYQGNMTKLSFYNNSSLTSLDYIDSTYLTSCEGMFNGSTSLTTVPLFDTSSVICMGAMFRRCNSLTSIPQFNTSNVTEMFTMFYECTSLTNVPLLDASEVVSTGWMFDYCTSLTTLGGLKDIGKAYTSTILGGEGSLDLSYCPLTHQSALNVLNNLYTVDSSKGYTVTFKSTVELTAEDVAIGTGKGWIIAGYTPVTPPTPNWASWTGGTTSSGDFPTIIGGTDYYSLTSPISKSSYQGNMTKLSFYCNSSLISLDYIDGTYLNDCLMMFYQCALLTTVPLFNTSSVTEMGNMFENCVSLITVPLFNTSNVTKFGMMFYKCTSLTSVPLFNTSRATTTVGMFENCTSLTTIPQFNTSNVTNMNYMFHRCALLTTVPLLDASNSKSVANMFTVCTSLTTLGGLKDLGKAYTSSTTLGSLDLSYCPLTHQSALNVLNNLYTVDSSKGYTVTFKATTYSTLEASEIAIGTNKGWIIAGYTPVPPTYWWASWTGGTTVTAEQGYSETIIGGTNYYSLTSPILKSSYQGNMTKLSFYNNTSLTSLDYIDSTYLNDCDSMFYNCTSLTSVPLFNTSNVTDMRAMFRNCGQLIAIPQFNTSNVTNMNSMFAFSGWNGLTVPLLDASNVTDIYYIFKNVNKLYTLGGLKDLGKAYTSSTTLAKGSLDLSICMLTHQSALNVLNNLYTVDSSKGYTVTFKSTTYSTLSLSEIAIGTGKGWVITS